VHQRRAQVGLVDELSDDAGLARQLGTQALDDERAPEALGPERRGRVDLGHAALAQAIEQRVAPEPHGAGARRAGRGGLGAAVGLMNLRRGACRDAATRAGSVPRGALSAPALGATRSAVSPEGEAATRPAPQAQEERDEGQRGRGCPQSPLRRGASLVLSGAASAPLA
jgi:hypothetical protein